MRAIANDVEVELKLLAGAEDLARLLRDRNFLAELGARPARKALLSHYFDTADRRLRRRGLVLRVRSDSGRWIQTLKAADDKGGAVAERGEWECEVRGPEPELDRIDDKALRERLGLVMAEELTPLFTTRFERHLWRVDWPLESADADADRDADKAVIELAVDRGEIEAEAARQPISEVELELVDGSPRALLAFARHLRRHLPLRIGLEDKARRGFRLIDGETSDGGRPRAQKAKPVALEAGMTTEAGLEAVVGACLDHWAVNEPAAYDGGDIEGVHQLRVALRRLRSALALFEAVIGRETRKAWDDRLRWLIRALAPARELDVFLEETLPPLLERMPEEPGLRQLVAEAEARRARAYGEVRRTLESADYADLFLDAVTWAGLRDWRASFSNEARVMAERQLGDHARELLDGRHRKVKKRGKGFDRLDAEGRHRLRLALKKLRYGTEFFAPVFDGDGAKGATKRYLKAASALQDALGEANDIAETRRLLDDLRREKPQLDHGAGVVIGWQAALGRKLEKKAARRWRRFKGRTPFWRG